MTHLYKINNITPINANTDPKVYRRVGIIPKNTTFINICIIEVNYIKAEVGPASPFTKQLRLINAQRSLIILAKKFIQRLYHV